MPGINTAAWYMLSHTNGWLNRLVFSSFFLLLPFWTKIAFFKQIIVILSPILSSVTIGCRAHCVTLTFNSFHSFIHSLYLLCVQYSFEWHKVHQNKTKPIEAFYNLHGTSLFKYIQYSEVQHTNFKLDIMSMNQLCLLLYFSFVHLLATFIFVFN